ncbi:hypothetical protein AURDEDRAFT_165885, partial [Auricularia subglabra TFB-10046 SS5]
LIIDDFDFLDDDPPQLMPRLPALRTLRITGNGPRLVELCAKDVIDIVRVLDLSCPLEALQIDHRIFEDGESEREMHHLANSVVVGVFHVPGSK